MRSKIKNKTFALFLFIIVLTIFYISLVVFEPASAAGEECDRLPKCTPTVRNCGCGGNQTRYTLCEGGCSEWYSCSRPDTEAECSDGTDNDCDGNIDCMDTDCAEETACIDEDGDGHSLLTDCNDRNPEINPGMIEVCNGRDDNCNGAADESLVRMCGETETGMCSIGEEICTGGRWTGCNAILPTTERCDGTDNDCDGETDEGCSCTEGATQACGTDEGLCEKGTQRCTGGRWSECTGGRTTGTEICENKLDDDCDRAIDEGCETEIETEAENASREETGTENISVSEESEEQTETKNKKARILGRGCIDKDSDGYGINCEKGHDCDDALNEISPSAQEKCNNRDDNCNGAVDESLTRACGQTETGECSLGSENCLNGIWAGCSAVLPVREVCGNKLDEDCDGKTDEECNAGKLEKTKTAEETITDIFSFKKKESEIAGQLENHKKTKEAVKLKKTASVVEGKTVIKLEIIPIKALYNFTIYESVPKSIAASTDELRFIKEPTEIIQKDPVFAWHFVELTEKAEVGYELKEKIEDAVERTVTVAIAEETKALERPWYFKLLPLLIIPLICLIFIVLVERAHEKKEE